MGRIMFLLAVMAAACMAQNADQPLPRELGSFALPFAAFIEAYGFTDFDGGDPSDNFTLYMTTFNAAPTAGPDPVFRLSSPGSILDQVDLWDTAIEQIGGDTAYWPNYPVRLPKEVSGFDGILQTSGFLVQGKKLGQLEVYNMEQDPPGGPWNIASLDDRDYSYHWVVFKDVDGDGLSDAFTARFNVGTFGATTSQLVWMKNPGNLGENGENWEDWEQSVLLEGEGDAGSPDVYLQFVELEADGVTYDVLVTGELWSERVMLYYVPADEPGAWADPDNIGSVVVDAAPGQPFEAEFLDVNADGVLEIVCSAFIGDERDSGNLWMYSMPEDFRDDGWDRIALASGFSANGVTFNNRMTPGKFRTFYPSAEYEAETTEFGPRKPLISLSGDDDGKHYVMYPTSEDRDDFDYDLYLMVETGGNTAGTMAVADLDGDGFVEIVSAGYSANTVYVHTFAP